MKSLLHLIIWVCRLGVGGLFIFSGLIKANDPLGFSYKLEEYFETFGSIFKEEGFGFLSHPMEWMASIALPMAMFIVVLEIVLGILTILGIKMRKVTLWLMALILFFTFLTFVSWKYDLVKTCGCFGDFWVLTPLESFLKDIYLLIGISVLFVFRNTIQTILNPIPQRMVIWCSSIVFFLFTFYCYRHLPVADHRAYSVGSSLLENMEVKMGNPLMIYKLKNKNNGVVVEISDFPDDYQNWEQYVDPDDSTASFYREINGELNIKFIKIKSTGQQTKVLEIPSEFQEDWVVLKDTIMIFSPNVDPKILDLGAYSFEDGEDKLQNLLTDSLYRFVLVIRDLDFYGEAEDTNDGKVFHKNAKGEKSYLEIKNLFVNAAEEGFQYCIFTSESNYDKIQAFQHEMDTRVPFYETNDIELKTMIRSSPGLILLHGDKVLGKWHYNDFPTFDDIKKNYIN